MSKSSSRVRQLLLGLPLALLSAAALYLDSAAVDAPPATPTQISDTATMSNANYEAYPSGINALAAPNVQPLIMLVMSRDEQLFNKAYPDFTDLDGDGKPDTTYTDSFAYNGYFDPNICYSYSSTGGLYKAAASVTPGTHKCATGKGYWSGNFLNWIAMSRLDVLRWTFYGGLRSTDTATSTILERAEIPNDLHAWTKSYAGSDIASFAPFSGATTFCNVSTGTTGQWKTPTSTTSGIQSTPVIRTAAGTWNDWASTEGLQCQDGSKTDGIHPSGTITNYTMRVQVCQNAAGIPNENFCVSVGSALKPEGLLQKYSKKDSNAKRFGLVTGSDLKARLAGQLRRNVGQLANNVTGTACAIGSGAGDGDEFSSVDGTFCYKSAKTAPSEGIVMTLDRLQIVGWTGTNYNGSASVPGCYLNSTTPWGARGSVIQGTPTMCPDFGNPLASMYATALNYLQGAAASGQDTGTDALPNPTWTDPYGTITSSSGTTTQRNLPCASCSIVLVSSGLNTFDAQNVPTVTGVDASSLTNAIQTSEGLTGNYLLSTYYNNSALTGAPANGTLTTAGTKYSDIALCQPANLAASSLAGIVGICNGAPGQQGSYLLAGLAYGAWKSPIRTKNVSSDFRIKTYGVSLSENLPSFTIPVGTGSMVLTPSCRADPANQGTFTSCYIGHVSLVPPTDIAGNTTYGLVPTATYPNVGSFYLTWEDSQYGSDHDMDATHVISWCVGASCNLPSAKVSDGVKICDPEIFNNKISTSIDSVSNACTSGGKLNFTPGPTDVVVRDEALNFSSSGMYIGFRISGSTNDGLTEMFINDGNNAAFGCALLGNVKDCKNKPQVMHFTLGTTAPVSTLQSPLWYATKYSGYTGSAPSLPAGQDPPNYFFARNAGALKAQLDTVFQAITSSAANDFGNATTPSSSNDIKGNGQSYQVNYYMRRNGVNWTGGLQAFWVDSDGYQREGTTDASGNQTLDAANARYIVAGPDNSAGALPGARTMYTCTKAPTASAGGTFDPTAPANAPSCSAVSATNAPKPAWDAATLLNALYDPSTSSGAAAIARIGTQRAYGDDAGATSVVGQRYIFTYLTASPNGSSATGTVVNGTQTDFVWNDAACDASGKYTLSATSGFCGKYDATNKVRTGNFGLLNEQNPTLAQSLLLWIRGKEDGTYRNRTSTSIASPATYRLGDIVDSSPAIVSTPAESYDLLYSDFSYAAFRANYRNRRQMVYVGANDGMLHAFNGGFYVPGQAANGSTSATKPMLYRQLPSGLTTGNANVPQGNNWSLGQEAWAFVPENLLAHLRWLADKNYKHVFYVDGSPVISDVKIFGAGSSSGCLAGKPSTDAGSADIDAKGHVCGWGTVMAVPFRLGGGPISVDVIGDGKTTSTQVSNSAYVLLDITDPEQPPTVLGEITTGSFALGAPAFAVHKENDGKLHFLLTIGSGPADNGGANGTKPVSAAAGSKLQAWVYDLASIKDNSSTPAATLTAGPDNSFAGDMVAADFDLNNSAEAVYFGVVTNPPAPSGTKTVPQVYGGGLWKIDLRNATATTADVSDATSWSLKEVINTGTPITIRPTVALDPYQRPTVFFGSGRSYTTNDDSGTSDQGTQQQYIYGVTDNNLLTGFPSSCQVEATVTGLYDVSAASVGTDGSVGGLTGVTTLSALQSALAATSTAKGSTDACYTYAGWMFKLTAGNADATIQQPSERVVNSQTLLGGILTTPTYIPANKADKDAAKTSDCNPVPVPGTSYLYGVNYLTGTADPNLAGFFGVDKSSTTPTVLKSVSLGSGRASAPVLHVGTAAGGGQSVKACFNVGGVTVCKDISAINAVSSGEISWREPIDNL
jgi:type IV pilus assembly protein PilY1